MKERLCSHCQGNGYVEYIGAPGYYSSSFGNYLPTEQITECPYCCGEGQIEVEEEADRLDGAA